MPNNRDNTHFILVFCYILLPIFTTKQQKPIKFFFNYPAQMITSFINSQQQLISIAKKQLNVTFYIEFRDNFIISLACMQDRSPVTCNCLSTQVPTQQKYFLTRKRQSEESDPSTSGRRVCKSSQLKNEIDGKGQKKSLKKRAGSFVHSDYSHQNSNDPNKRQQDIRINPLQQVHTKSLSYWGPPVENASYQPNPPVQNTIHYRYPQSAATAKHAIISNSQRGYPNQAGYQPQIINPSYNPPQIYIEKPPAQLRPQLQQFHKETAQYQYYQELPQPQHIPAQIHPEPTFRPMATKQQSSYQVTFQGFASHIAPISESPFNVGPRTRLQSQSWAPNEQDLMIEGFDKLFKNKEQNKSHSNLLRDNHIRARQVQKSKRLQAQGLFGRFAESDDEGCSDSPPSEVIGKGFDRTYQDILESDIERVLVSQTKASRSTNTKVSEMQRGQQSGNNQHEKAKFGNVPSFKSYKLL